MTKAELINAVAKNDCTITNAIAERAVNKIFEEITNSIVNDGKFALVGFGTFTKTHISERQGRNLQTGEPMTIPAHNSVHFKAGKKLKDALK